MDHRRNNVTLRHQYDHVSDVFLFVCLFVFVVFDVCECSNKVHAFILVILKTFLENDKKHNDM